MIDLSFINILIKDLGFYTIMIPLLIMAGIFTLPKFMDSTTYFKSRKIKYINEALDSNWVDSDSKRILSESVSRIYLSSALNIKVNKKEVKEILKIYDMLNESFNTIEIYYGLRVMPKDFFVLSLEEAKEKREDILGQSRVNTMLIVITIFSMFCCYTYFSYHLVYAIKNDFFFDSNYLYNEFSFIIGAVISTVGFIVFYSSVKEFKNARNIMSHYISNLE